MPLQIAFHPVQSPSITRADEPYSRDRSIRRHGVVLPIRSNLENVNGMPNYCISYIDLSAKVFWGASLFNEPFEGLEIGGPFEFSKGHCYIFYLTVALPYACAA